MSVKQALLALVAEQPRYGYQLRAEFEQRTGGTWPLNIGQVYTTLQRLERDELVTSAQADDAGAVVYEITQRGREEVAAWWASPVPRAAPARDETTIKFAMALSLPGVDIARLLQAQRRETIQALQHLTRLKRTGNGSIPPLILDRLIFDAEAEARWLDHIEAGSNASRRAGAMDRTPTTAAATTRQGPNTRPEGTSR